MEWKNIYRGLMMGASDVIPGVSGGTIAVLLGIYDRLIKSISGIFSKDWKRHLGFLIPLGIGMAAAVLLLSKVIEWLFEHHPVPTNFFFLGLIIGILPYLFRQADVKNTFNIYHIILLVIGAVLISLMIFLNTNEGAVITDRSIATYVLLFFSGMAGSAAMILPGISGSLVLLIIGVYSTVISAISQLQFDVLAVVGLGILCGILVVSKIIHFFLTHYRIATFALIIGLVIGSIVVVFPGWPLGMSVLLISVVTFAAGLFVAYILGKVEYKA
jgi:putative membrane protein